MNTSLLKINKNYNFFPIMYENLQKTACFDCRISTIWFSKFIEGIGTKKLYLTESIVKVRNVALTVYFGELFLSCFRIGLYSIRRFVFSIIVNIVFLVLTLAGGYGALVLNPFLVIVHWGGVFIAYVIFIIMMIATLTQSSGDGNGEIFVYYIPLILEAIPLISLLYFNVVICKFQINFEKMEKLRIQTERNEEINVDFSIIFILNYVCFLSGHDFFFFLNSLKNKIQKLETSARETF